jgi:hypothetical protein
MKKVFSKLVAQVVLLLGGCEALLVWCWWKAIVPEPEVFALGQAAILVGVLLGLHWQRKPETPQALHLDPTIGAPPAQLPRAA